MISQPASSSARTICSTVASNGVRRPVSNPATVSRLIRAARAKSVFDPKYRLTLREADQTWEDFAAILDGLDFLKIQVSWLPACAWLSRSVHRLR